MYRLATYTSSQTDSRTDRQTDDIMMTVFDHSVSVRSAKNSTTP